MYVHACSGREHVNTHRGIWRGSGRLYRGSLFTLVVVRWVLFPSGISQNFTHNSHETLIDIPINCLAGSAKPQAKQRGADMLQEQSILGRDGHPRNLLSEVSVS